MTAKEDRFGSEPIPDDGVKLTTVNRGPNRELRVRWKAFNGHPYLDIREWRSIRTPRNGCPRRAKAPPSSRANLLRWWQLLPQQRL